MHTFNQKTLSPRENTHLYTQLLNQILYEKKVHKLSYQSSANRKQILHLTLIYNNNTYL